MLPKIDSVRLFILISVVSVCGYLVGSQWNKSIIIISADSSATAVKGIEFDKSSLVEKAPGSDNWAVTCVSPDVQITSWGDGGGFEGNNQNGRVSLGVGKLVGSFENFQASNIYGGVDPVSPAILAGKSYGLLSIKKSLWMWKTGNASDDSAFIEQSLYKSVDAGKSWKPQGVTYKLQKKNRMGFFAPTFLQFGPGYHGAIDQFVYSYAVEVKDVTSWEAQTPGEVVLFRVHKDKMDQQKAYQFYSGKDENSQPLWSHNYSERMPVLTEKKGLMRISANYNSGLKKFFIIAQVQSRFKENDGKLGLYESDSPWGPWQTVFIVNPWKYGLHEGHKTVFWNFSNCWTSKDGKDFVLIYTGPGDDNFGAMKGHFLITTDNI